MSTATLAKTAAENQQLKNRVAELEGKLAAAETKIAAAEKRAAAETMLVEVARDPRAPLDMKPVDVDDFLAKRAQLEALASIDNARTAVKMASARSFAVGEPDATVPTQNFVSGSKAEEEFVNWLQSADTSA